MIMACLSIEAVLEECLQGDSLQEGVELQDIGREEIVRSSTTRKRKSVPSEWARNARKLKRARGEE